jgi:hypothetical protein
MIKLRGVVLAENKKQSKIKELLIIRDEMIKNSIDENLIKKYVDSEYIKISKEFEDRVNKYNQKKQNDKKSNINIKKKKEKAIEFLLKNKFFLENNGASKEYITEYVNKQYAEINDYYNKDNFTLQTIDNDEVDFID